MSTDEQDKAVREPEAAFPTDIIFADGKTSTHFGLTKRELFAGMAMQGLLGNQELLNALPFPDLEIGLEEIARMSVCAADALLAALEVRHDS